MALLDQFVADLGAVSPALRAAVHQIEANEDAIQSITRRLDHLDLILAEIRALADHCVELLRHPAA